MHSNTISAGICSFLLFLAACGEVVPIDNTAAVDAAPTEVADAMVELGPCEVDDIALDDLLDCLLVVQCERLVTCESFAPTVEACIALINQLGGFDLERTIEAVDAGRSVYNGEAAADCLVEIETASCNESAGEDCDDVFVGTIPDGGLCYEENECSGVGASCERPNCQDQCCMGTCVDAAPLGGDCESRPCESGAHCVFNQGNTPQNQCFSGEVGVTCQDDYDCDNGLYCPDTTCQPALAAGASCSTNNQCLHPLTCVGEGDDAGLCAAVDTVGATCDSGCEGNLFCEIPKDATLGACSAPKNMGGQCQYDSQCLPHLFCSDLDNQCRLRPTLGMMCEDYSCASGLYCTGELPITVGTGMCAEPGAVGDDCSRDTHCTTGICNDSDLCEAYLSCY